MNLYTLAVNCHESLHNKFVGSLLGIVVDFTRPLYRQKENNYIVELKIIDQSVNCVSKYGVMTSYCSVFLFASQPAELLLCREVGDIVYLSQFVFRLWNGIKLEAKYMGSIDSLYCFDVQLQAEKVTIARRLTPTEDALELTSSLVCEALQLKAYFMRHFRSLFSPALGLTLANNFSINVEPFDMILKVQSEVGKTHTLVSMKETHQENVKQRTSNDPRDIVDPKLLVSDRDKQGEVLSEGYGAIDRCFLVDSNSNKYFLKEFLGSDFKAIQFGKHVYLRGVRGVGSFYEIMLTETGNLLTLPDEHHKYYFQLMNYCAVHRFAARRRLNLPSDSQLTEALHGSRCITPISQLLRLQGQYKFRDHREELGIADRYLIEAVLINFEGQLGIYECSSRMLLDEEYLYSLSLDERRQYSEQSPIKYVYEGSLQVLDRSSQAKEQLLELRLFTYDDKGTFFERQLVNKVNGMLQQIIASPSKRIEEATVREAQTTINYILRRLLEATTFERRAQLVVESVKSDLLLFRVVDTKLLTH